MFCGEMYCYMVLLNKCCDGMMSGFDFCWVCSLGGGEKILELNVPLAKFKLSLQTVFLIQTKVILVEDQICYN